MQVVEYLIIVNKGKLDELPCYFPLYLFDCVTGGNWSKHLTLRTIHTLTSHESHLKVM